MTVAAYVPPYAYWTRVYYAEVERELQEAGVEVISRECGPYVVDRARYPDVPSPMIGEAGDWVPWWAIYYTIPARQAQLVVGRIPRIGNPLNSIKVSSFEFMIRPGACGDLPESIIGPATGF